MASYADANASGSTASSLEASQDARLFVLRKMLSWWSAKWYVVITSMDNGYCPQLPQHRGFVDEMQCFSRVCRKPWPKLEVQQRTSASMDTRGRHPRRRRISWFGPLMKDLYMAVATSKSLERTSVDRPSQPKILAGIDESVVMI